MSKIFVTVKDKFNADRVSLKDEPHSEIIGMANAINNLCTICLLLKIVAITISASCKL